MPEYLSPRVYVEEIPSRFKALEGVSTSTTAFVGPAQRGPVPGVPLPFVPPAGFVLEPDPAPVLVTSFGDYTRTFGAPLPLPLPTDTVDHGYLGYAAKSYYDNGGRRLYVSRVVGDAATYSQGTAPLGMVLRLARRATSGSTRVTLRSLRGIAVGNTIEFRRRADGMPALSQPAAPAVLPGGAAPFALEDGATFDIDVGGPPFSMTPISAHPVVATTVGSAPFPIADGEQLQVRVGGNDAPVQTIVFDATADDFLPGTVTAAKLAEMLNDKLVGVSVTHDGTQVTVATDVRGTDASLQFIGGPLTFGPPSQILSNVADASAVTIAEIASLFAPTGFTIGDDGSGSIQLQTTTTGQAAEITVSGDVPTLDSLGLSGTAQGSDSPGSANLTIISYDTRASEVVLNAALPDDLDPEEVYALSPATSALLPSGPRIWGRSPGAWSRDVRIEFTPADRPPVALVAAAAANTSLVQVRNPSSFYVGAIVEADSGVARTYHEVIGISGQTVELGTPLASALDPQSAFLRVVEIDVTISDLSGAAPTEVYRGLSWNRSTQANLARHFATPINAQSRLVWVEPGPGSATLADQPTTTNGFAMALATIGDDDFPAVTPAGDAAYVGTDNGPGQRTGIEALTDLDRVSIVAAPGRTTPAVQLALVTHCELMRYRVAVLDGEQNPAGGAIASVISHRNTYDSSYAAYYAPWIGVTVEGRVRHLPPSGFVTGIYARTDNQRGVWKAPANEVVSNAQSLRTDFTNGEQDVLNPVGVNLVRKFDQRGIRVWGARTLSSDPEFRYLNVRRTLNAIEESIDIGTQWVVFEPNAPATWSRLRDSVRAFLQTWWRDGALLGRNPEQAFSVRCDESTMTVDDIQNGRLICRIGVAIVRPAEFVIFRIEQTTGLSPA